MDLKLIMCHHAIIRNDVWDLDGSMINVKDVNSLISYPG